MARTRGGAGSGLTRYETVLGFVYLPSYFFLLPLLLQTLFGAFGVRLTDLTLNLLYYSVNFVVILLIFHRFFLESARRIRLWPFVQTVILGLVFYYAMAWAVGLAISALSPELQNPNNLAVDALAAAGGWRMSVCVVLLGPVVEEALLRGLLFGTLRRHGRALAYAVSVLVFAAMHLWQFALQTPPATLALSALQYVPGGVALAWTYDKSESIWGSVLVHSLINAAALGIFTLL